MSQISCPEIFTDAGAGREVNAERLNNALGALTALPGLITEQASGTPAVADSILFYKASTRVLSQNSFTALLAALMPTDPDAATAGMRTLGTTSVKAAAGNDTRFPALVTGIRKSAGNGSTDTAATPPDYALTPTVGTVASNATTLTCSTNNRFTVVLTTATFTLTLASFKDGDTIVVRTQHTASDSSTHTLNFVATSGTISWIGGAQPTPTITASRYDFWTFKVFGTVLYGNAELNFT